MPQLFCCCRLCFQTAEGIVEFLKDNLSHEKAQLSFFATEFIAVLQHPFTTVSYVKGGHAGDHAAASTGGSYPWKQNNTGWTNVTSSKNSPSSSLPNNNVNAAGVATRASANKPSSELFCIDTLCSTVVMNLFFCFCTRRNRRGEKKLWDWPAANFY